MGKTIEKFEGCVFLLVGDFSPKMSKCPLSPYSGTLATSLKLAEVAVVQFSQKYRQFLSSIIFRQVKSTLLAKSA